MAGKEDVINKIKEYATGWNAIKQPLEEIKKEFPEESKMLEDLFKEAICWNWVLALADDLKTQKGLEKESNAINNIICISECSTRDFIEFVRGVYEK